MCHLGLPFFLPHTQPPSQTVYQTWRHWNQTEMKLTHAHSNWPVLAHGPLASFPGSCAGKEEREPGTHCLCMHQVPLVTYILLRYSKITVNFCLPAERPHCIVILPVEHIRAVLTVCIASFEAIGELQRDRLHHSRAAAFSWKGRMCGQFLQAKSWVPLSLPRHRLHRVWSVEGFLYMGEVSVPPKS